MTMSQWGPVVGIVCLNVANAVLLGSIDPRMAPDIVFCVECLKFVISVGLTLHFRDDDFALSAKHVKHFMLFVIPSVIYAVNNNLAFHAVSLVGVVNFQVLGQLKILTTAILTSMLLQHHVKLDGIQWCGIIVLTSGVMIRAVSTDFSLAIPVQGFLEVLMMLVLSSFAGVFTERCFKSETCVQSVWLKNSQLYFHGMVVNSFARLYSLGEPPNLSLLASERLVAPVILAQVLSGICVGWLLKFHSNIVKDYITTVAMILVSAGGVIWFGEKLKLDLILCVVLVSASVFLRNHDCHERDNIKGLCDT